MWKGLESKHFFVSEYDEPFKKRSINLLFHFDRTFDVKFNLNVFRFRTEYQTQIQAWFGRGLYLYSPIAKDSMNIVDKLLTLFSNFLGEMKSPKTDRTIRVFSQNNSFEVTPPLDEMFEYYCRILDDFMEALNTFNFQLPVPVKDNEPSHKIKEVVKQLEKSLGTSFEILPESSEEAEVNERMKKIYIWTEEPSIRAEREGISNCATSFYQDRMK